MLYGPGAGIYSFGVNFNTKDTAMRRLTPLLALTMFFAACGGPQMTPEERAAQQARKAEFQAAKSEARTVEVNGNTFSVSHLKERNSAVVEQVGKKAPYFVADVEAASRAATGCKSTFKEGVLAFLSGDLAKTDLSRIKINDSTGASGWHTGLSC